MIHLQEYLLAFVVGGWICVMGQVLMDLTPLTSAHVLVVFVVAGGILSGLGLYQPLVEVGGAGATVPLPGFGHLMVSSTIAEVDRVGFLGIFSGAIGAAAMGITAAIVFGLAASLIFDPKG
ncbi:MAG: stage V sporulation protein AE [Sporomusaceae bacterium]|jgi:stage V sporulation protein AE|nr:stage V sporulation protein AE [Sporomusaceae bacterium]